MNVNELVKDIIENTCKNYICETPEDFESITYDTTVEYSEEFAEKNPEIESVNVFHDALASEDMAVFEWDTNMLLWIDPEVKKLLDHIID